MRNLKKFLALVLAFVMAMSLMVTVNAASSDFADSEDVNEKFEEAVEVLTSLDILKGYDMGDDTVTFQPGKTVTRAEMAALVYRLASGDADESRAYLYAGGSNFTDVTEDKWYAGVVGYCATYNIIAGVGNNRFNPVGEVTGYQALAMILRAVGYDQNGEFTNNPTWQSNVAQIATVEGLLSNVNSTSYAGKLSQPATRELIAEFLFQGAQIPTVTYTPALGYNKYTSLLATDREENPSLGQKGYGLDSCEGIIVGNQATGEKYTLLGLELNYKSATEQELTGNGSYVYTDAAASSGTAGNVKLSFDIPSGIDVFGHKAKIWFDNRTSGAKTAALGGTTFDTQYSGVYTVINKSTKTAVVYAGSETDVTDATAADKLGKIIDNAGFAIGADTAYESDAFGPISDTVEDDVTNTVGDSGAYLLISNSDANSKGKNPVDLIVALNVSVDAVDAVNNYRSPKTVTMDAFDTNGSAAGNGFINRAVDSADKTKHLLVYGEEAVKVGQDVVLNLIAGTGTEGITTNVSAAYTSGTSDAAGAQFFVGLNALTEEKEGTITAISGNGAVTLAGGETIKMSPLWNVTGGGSGSTHRTIGNTVTFILDVNGDYVDCYVPGNVTLAGAYAYWVQDGIDNFKYYLQGVTKTGEIVTREVTKDSYNSVIAQGTDDLEIRHMTTNANSSAGAGVYIAVPNATGTKTNINGYQEYTIDGANVVAESTNWDELPASESWNAKSNVITSTTKYFNADTQFHVVTGWGSTLDVKHYTGLTELLQGASSIEVAGWYFTGADDTEHVNSNNDIVEHVVLVKASLIQPNTFLYTKDDISDQAGGAPATVDGKAHQFQLYVAGEDKTSGILVADYDSDQADSEGTAYNGTDSNTFFTYSLTAEGYRIIKADAMDGTEYGYSSDVLTNAGTAFGDIKDSAKTYHAADAKVIDLTDHGINSYAALRRAVEENSGIKVDVLLTSVGGDTASVIYVHTFA